MHFCYDHAFCIINNIFDLYHLISYVHKREGGGEAKGFLITIIEHIQYQFNILIQSLFKPMIE